MLNEKICFYAGISIIGLCSVIFFETPMNTTFALGITPNDRKLQNQLNALVAGINDDAIRYNRIKDPLLNAVNSWYTVPAATSARTVLPYTVYLKKLKCFTTEDNTGADESALRIYVDGRRVFTHKKNLNDGNTLTINKSYNFNSSFKMKLYDEDNPGFPWYDDDDWLGDVTVKKATGNDYSAAFNRDGALYIITYDVNFSYTPAVSVEQQKALVMNDYFNAYIKKPNITGLTKAALYSDITRTIKDPFRQVNQERTSTCGTSATILELARKFPKKFVQSCWEVYATNQLRGYDGRTYTFNLASAQSTRNSLSATDWILTGIVNPTYSGTNNTKLQNIMKALLPYKTAGTQTTYVYGEEDAIRRAARIVKNGGAAFLKINSKMINQEYSTLGAWIWQPSDHIIVMLGDLAINNGNPVIWDSGHFTFNYWSWGKAGYMMYAREGRFEDGFLGLTYGY